ncbi:MAG: CHAP domain-containing protein [Myxococcales bacterium]
MRLAILVLISTGLAACAAPTHLARRSPLSQAPTALLTPEGRPAALPSMDSKDGEGVVAIDGAAVAAAARELVGKKKVPTGGKFPDDCTGLVRTVYEKHGIDLMSEGAEAGGNGVLAIWRYTQKHGSLHKDRPRPGDIVFFNETYDRNRDGRDNDGLTHVGIVDRVEDDGTVYVIHRVAYGVVSYRMNLAHPSQRKDAQGRVLNDWLREGKKSRLAGELFAGYGTVGK